MKRVPDRRLRVRPTTHTLIAHQAVESDVIWVAKGVFQVLEGIYPPLFYARPQWDRYPDFTYLSQTIAAGVLGQAARGE